MKEIEGKRARKQMIDDYTRTAEITRR